MSPLEMIAEWEKGCSCAGPAHDAIFHPKNPTSATECEPFTQGLIDALKTALVGRDEELFRAGCEAFEGKSHWASVDDLWEQHKDKDDA